MNQSLHQIKALQQERTQMLDMIDELTNTIGTSACKLWAQTAPTDSEDFIDALIKKLLEVKGYHAAA